MDKGWPRISQDLPRYNHYFHSGQDLQCSTMQQHRTQNWEDTSEEPKWFSEKSIHVSTENITAITMLFKNTKVIVCSPDGDIDYFDIVAGVLQGDTFGTYLIIICLDCVVRTSIDKMKHKGFKLYNGKKQKKPSTNNYERGLCRFWQMHPPKPNPCDIVRNEQLIA